MGFSNNWGAYLAAPFDYVADPDTFALDGALVYLTSGDAVAWRFVAPATTTLVNVWVYIPSVAGTPASPTNDLSCILCQPASATKPGTAIASTTGAARTTAGWVKCTFSSPPNVTIGTMCWIVIGQATTGANYHNILDRNVTAGGHNSRIRAYRDVTGFASASTALSVPVGLIKFGNGMVQGNPFTSTAGAWTTGTYARGLYIPGFSGKITLEGFSWEPATYTSVLKIFEGSEAPGGTAKYTLTLDSYGGLLGIGFFAPITLEAATPYRFVIVPPSNDTRPRYVVAENVPAGDEADFLAAMPLGGCATYDNSGSWVNYDGYADLRYPFMGPIFGDTVAPAAGGGLLVHPGMSGGMRG